MVQKTVEQLNLGFGLFEVSRKRAASNRDTRKWLSEMEIGFAINQNGANHVSNQILGQKWPMWPRKCATATAKVLQTESPNRLRSVAMRVSSCEGSVGRGKSVLRKVIPCRVEARRGDTGIIAVSMATHLQHANENSNELSATRAVLWATLAGCQ